MQPLFLVKPVTEETEPSTRITARLRPALRTASIRISALDARIGFTWTHGGKTPYLAGEQSINVDAGIPGLPTDKTVLRRLSNESVKNFSYVGCADIEPAISEPVRRQSQGQLLSAERSTQHEVRLGVSLHQHRSG